MLVLLRSDACRWHERCPEKRTSARSARQLGERLLAFERWGNGGRNYEFARCGASRILGRARAGSFGPTLRTSSGLAYLSEIGYSSLLIGIVATTACYSAKSRGRF